MPVFTVTNGTRVLHVQAACRTCARRIAVEHIAQSGPTATWRDPEQTKIEMIGRESGPSGVLKDEG